MRSHRLRASLAGSGGYTSGTFYPMFAIKVFDAQSPSSRKDDVSADPPISSFCEQPMQRALSFDTGNTTELDGTETIAEIITILDASKYTCNSDFGTGGETISAIKIEHWENSTNKYNEGEFAFDGGSFNIFDHACNVTPNLHSNGNMSTGTFQYPAQLGSITSASLDGTAITSDLTKKIMVNSSTSTSTTQTDNNHSWADDSGDYCFLGISDHNPPSNADQLDKQFATTKGLAFGISDSCGTSAVDGVRYGPGTITTGIGRRSVAYFSIFTNWAEKKASLSHSGNTISGYVIVYGKVN